MLGTWFRYKYPHIIDGVIAGSAPIWNFDGEVHQLTEWKPLSPIGSFRPNSNLWIIQCAAH